MWSDYQVVNVVMSVSLTCRLYLEFWGICQ